MPMTLAEVAELRRLYDAYVRCEPLSGVALDEALAEHLPDLLDAAEAVARMLEKDDG